MPPKNAKPAPKGDEKVKPVDSDKLTEVNKVQYEIQISSLDSKIQRLTGDVKKAEDTKLDIENKIDELKLNKKKVISFLSDQLKRKTDELQDLEEKLEGSRQEFDLEVAELNKNLADQNLDFISKKTELETRIQDIKDEIDSLMHFQKIRKEIEEEELKLSEKVEQQRTKYKNGMDVLDEREKADFIRMKRNMIQRVNMAATDFRKTADQRVPPTIKRAIKENQQVQSALRKMEINCKEINHESQQYQLKYEEMANKKQTLYNTELHLAHQSHAKSFLITKLKAKCNETSEELKLLELREAKIDEKQHILNQIKSKIENNLTVTAELQSEVKRLEEYKREELDKIEVEQNKIKGMKDLLSKCGSDILDHSHITRSSIDELMSFFSLTMEIPDAVVLKRIKPMDNLWKAKK